MKKINAFFIPIFLIAMFSCCPNEEHTKNTTVDPPLPMSSLKVLPSAGTISLDDIIEFCTPENAPDADMYYELAVEPDSCPEPTEKSTKYVGAFTLRSKGLPVENDAIITLKILAVKTGFEPLSITNYWRFSDGSAAVIDDDAHLKSVTISNVQFDFSAEKFVYNDIKVPNNVTSVSVGYEKSNINATVEKSPVSLENISLTAGETTQVILTVTSPDKTKMKRYLFCIYRAGSTENIKSNDCSLASLSVTGAQIQFDKDKLNYEVQLPNLTEKTAVKYSLSDSKATAISTPTDLENISLLAGEAKTISITVTAEDETTRTYTVSIYRQRNESQKSTDATLKSLSVTGGSLSFDSSKTDYDVEIPANHTGNVSVTYKTNDPGATVIAMPSNLDAIPVVEGSSTKVTIIVTAEDAVTSKMYTINLTRQARAQNSNADLKSITLSAGSLSFNAATTSYSVSVANSVASVTVTAEAQDSNASVNITPSSSVPLIAGSTTTITIQVIAEDGTPKTYTISVTRAASSGGGGGGQGEDPVQTQYYWTNKDGAVGTNKTISSWSDWTEAEKIAQCAAYDDPRTWRGIQEVPYDVYALYAAWDNSNLYLLVELSNVVGQMANGNGFMWHDYASSDNACWWNRNTPLGLSFNTGMRALANSPALASGGVVWDSVDFSDEYGFDVLMYHSSKWGNDDNKGGAFQGVGTPFFGTTTSSSGKFSYEEPGKGYSDLGIEIRFKDGMAVSTQVYFEATPTGNRTESGQDGQALVDSTNYKAVTPDGRSTSYWYKIPLSALGIDKSYLESTGIGVRQLTTGGGSLMDCCPWDISMVDVASEECSDDESTSAEKRDKDELTSPFARIGHK